MKQGIEEVSPIRNKARNWLVGCMALAQAEVALAAGGGGGGGGAAGGSLVEAENTATWVLDIFSPALLLALLTIILIGSGLAVYFGRMSGGMFFKILIGSILIFGARNIAPRIIAMI